MVQNGKLFFRFSFKNYDVLPAEAISSIVAEVEMGRCKIGHIFIYISNTSLFDEKSWILEQNYTLLAEDESILSQ